MLQILLALFLFVQFSAHAEIGQLDRQKFPNGSAEDAVISLMKFDFNGGVRQDPDSFSKWLHLTTAGEPDASESSPYWSCSVGTVISSFNVLGKEALEPGEVRVLIEVDMVAIIASAEMLEKKLDRCNWPELSTVILNGKTGEEFWLVHPLSASEFITQISDERMDSSSVRVSDYADAEERLIKIADDRRRWRFKVDVVLKDGKWRVSSDLLPRPHLGLPSAIRAKEREIAFAQKAVKICAGVAVPPSVYYKALNCPPPTSPEKELKHKLDELNLLKKIQGAEK